MWFYVERMFDNSPLLILKKYRTQQEAEMAGARETVGGTFRVVSFDTADKREVYRQWKASQQYSQNNQPAY